MGIEVVFDDYLVRKQAVPDYKIMYFTWSPYLNLLRGLTHLIGQKLEISC